MPSVQEIADQLEAELQQIVSNTALTASRAAEIKDDTAAINAELQQVDAHLQAGVDELAGGLFAVLEAQKRGNSIAEHQVAQNDTVICTLNNVADLLCGITRKLSAQLAIQEQFLARVGRVEGMLELVHAREAVEYDRAGRLQSQIEECCPPEEPRPEPCPEHCHTPKADLYDPQGQDWRPATSSQQKPIG